MPTEVSVAPFRYEQQFPLSLEHPRTWAAKGPRPIHQFGPNNALGLFAASPPSVVSSGSTAPQPGQILPNGVRNPWAPYEGGSYIPSSEGVANRLAGEYAGAGTIVQAAQPIAGSRIVPPNMTAGPMTVGRYADGGSVIAPSRHAPGAYRVDEGWNGSLGRNHLGHLPDATSTAGRLGSSMVAAGAPGGGSWLHAPSSWQNHARMSASLPMPMHQQAGQVPLHRGAGVHSGTPPLAAPAQGRRASLAVSVEDCPDCFAASPPRDSGLQRVRSMSSSTSRGTGRRPRRDSLLSKSSPLKVDVAEIGGDSPYQPLGRRPSNSSTGSSSTKRPRGHGARPRRDSCSQCV